MWKSCLRLFALLLCLSSLDSAALRLIDGQNYIYDIGQDGMLISGTLNAYNGLYGLRVNNATYTGSIIGLSADGREARTSVFTDPVSGLEAERRIYVSRTLNFARYTEILRNPTDEDKTVSVEIFGNLGSGNNTAVLEQRNNLVITDDRFDGVTGSAPVLLHYHTQIGNRVFATGISILAAQIKWDYSTLSEDPTTKQPIVNPGVTVPAQSQIRLLYFVAQTADPTEAARMAGEILQNSAFLYDNITDDERKQLLNFTPPPLNLTVSTPVAVTPGEPLRNATLTDNDTPSRRRPQVPADTYQLTLNAGQTVTISMAASFNAYLYLYADQTTTQVLAANDDRDQNTSNAMLVFTAPGAGTYFLEATALSRKDRGNYSLSITDGSNNRPPQAYNFEYPLATQNAPAAVTFSDFSLDPDGQITERCWQFGDGSPIVCGGESVVQHTYTQPGRFSVGLTVRDNSGAYDFRNERLNVSADPVGVVINLSNTVTGELVDSDSRSLKRTSAFTDSYVLTTANVGEELVIDLMSEEFDGYLYLYDRFRQLLRQDDNSGDGQNARIRYTPTVPGSLLIEATTFRDNQAGNYTLSVNPAKTAAAQSVFLEASTNLNNPLRALFIARLPTDFRTGSLTWNFGDGTPNTVTSDAIVSHTFARSGSYTVNFSAESTDGNTLNGSRSFSINAMISIPDARFRATPLFGEAPLRSFFNNASGTPLAGDSLSYLWDFGDGQVSTDLNPAHNFTREGTYQVVLKAFSTLTNQSASFNQPIAVFDRNSPKIPVTGQVRLRPQVIMAGFDPMLVDVLDTDLRVFAVVRPGASPLRTVAMIQNQTVFLVMQHVATYANGDQRYEAVFTFPQGSIATAAYGALFGTQSGQFRIQATDQANQFHAFPNLELTSNPPFTGITPASLRIEPLRQVGVRRGRPQVLAAGFDPALMDSETDDTLTVTAIVREGVAPVQSVTLRQNIGNLSVSMQQTGVLPSGDYLYTAHFSYPLGTLVSGTFGNLFSNQPSAEFFSIEVRDTDGLTHRFPELRFGNFPAH